MSAGVLRHDPITATWVTIAAHRRGLAMPLPPPPVPPIEACPFCPGRESETEVTTLRLPHDGAWAVRVVPNKYPVVAGDPADFAPGTDEGAALGAHEVVIESPDHFADLSTLNAAQASLVVRAWRDRVAALSRVPGVQTVAVFRNRGRRAGSSQPHPHSQIIALPFVPSEVARRAELARAHRGSLLDAVRARDCAGGTRVVEQSADFVAYCPFASHRAFETWLVQTGPITPFELLDDDDTLALGALLARTAARLARVTAGLPDYNVVLRLPPCADASSLPWHVELLPRSAGPAGLELATGLDVCTVAPEHAAEQLRGAAPSPVPPTDAQTTEHVLADGTRIRVRPLRKDDAAELVRQFETLSPQTRYRRFLENVEKLTPAQIRYLTEIDQKEHIAYVATRLEPGHFAEVGLGVARSIREPGTDCAESAIVIVDAWQGKGVGHVLLAAVARRAWETGIRRWRATLLAENRAVQRLMTTVAVETARQVEERGAVEVEYALRPPA